MFRFTIRDVLLVMALTGLALGWWIDHRQLRTTLARIQRSQAELQQQRAEQDRRFRAERTRYIYTLREAAARGLTPADISYEHP